LEYLPSSPTVISNALSKFIRIHPPPYVWIKNKFFIFSC
jgi:hypothetical protein